MRTLGALPSFRSSRNPVSTLGFFVLVIFLAYEASHAILNDDFTSLAITGALVVASAVAIAVLNDWRRGVYLLIGWILFEDFVRKYLGNNMLIFFAKDILAILLYISFFRTKRTGNAERFKIPFGFVLGIFFWFCILQTFNPASTSVYYGIVGLSVVFLYVPLIYVGHAFIDSEVHLQRVFSFFCVLILIIAGLGLAQSIIGPSFLNPTGLQEDIRELSTTYRVAPISGLAAYRPNSVFVSAGRFQDFLILAWLISLGFSGYLLQRTRQGRFLAFLTVGVVAAASLMSASRGVFMWNAGILLIVISGFLWGAGWRKRELSRFVRVVQRTMVLIGIGFIVLLTVFPNALGSRLAIYSETLRPDSPSSELFYRTQTYPLMQLQAAFENPRWLYGNGFGTCTLGWQYVARFMDAQPMLMSVESAFGNLVVELGIGGLVLWILLGLRIAVCSWKVVLQLRGMPWYPLAFAIWLYAIMLFFPMMYTGVSTYQDFVLNSSLWLLLGILFRLAQYGATQKAALRTAAGQA